MSQLQQFIDLCKFEVPSMKIVSKKDSRLMRFLDKILFFVPNFMTSYTTAIGDTIYVPDSILKAINEGSPRIIGLLAHEMMHLLDRKRLGTVPFAVMYLFPQLGALLALFSLVAIWSSPHFLWALLFLLLLLPIPSKGRAGIERWGYFLTLMWHRKQYGDNRPVPGWILENFSGPAYYFMWPFSNDLEKWFNDQYALTKKDVFLDPWMKKFKTFIEESNEDGVQ